MRMLGLSAANTDALIISVINVTKEITDIRCDFRIDVSFLYGFDYVCGDSEYL